MAASKTAYGTWKSPLSPQTMANTSGITDAQWDGDTLVWLDSRPGVNHLWVQRHRIHGMEAPRAISEGKPIRGTVGYGGGDFAVQNGMVFFIGRGGRVYRQALQGGRARPITPEFGDAAAPVPSPDGKWVVYVHHHEGDDLLAIVDANGAHFPKKLVSGNDFVMQPVWHPGGGQIAYVTWDQPQMPWDGTQLWIAHLNTDEVLPTIVEKRVIAGGLDVSIFQPQFSPDGRSLAYASDASGWGQLTIYDLETDTHRRVIDREGEFSTPAWIQGLRTYGWLSDSRRLLCIVNHETRSELVLVDSQSGTAETLDSAPYTHLMQIHIAPDDRFSLIASSTVIPMRLVVGQIVTDESATSSSTTLRTVWHSSAENIAPLELSTGEPIVWTGDDGETVYGLYYPPAKTHSGIGLPPLMVIVHGGPTSQTFADYQAEAQFFATRGFAVLYVNHRGSTGYGRTYQDAGRGTWGMTDVEDCASGVRALAERGLIDRAKCVIMGGSAGGLTALQSLVTMPGFYRAAVCRYAVSNQFTLVLNAEGKFEARYSEGLLGALPEAAVVYRARSPVFHTDKIVDPVILFHGDVDTVVPKAQSDQIVAALAARGVPHEYHVYKGEGHGFRNAATIEDYYTKTLNFLMQYVVFA